MNSFNSIIQCPKCGSDIIINTKQLLLGVKFNCYNCRIIVGLSQDSRRNVEDAVKRLETFNIKSTK